MKLYIRQKIFSWTDRFTVKDESGMDVYSVVGEFFSWGKKLHVFDMSGKEVAFIKQKVWSFMPHYYIYVNGEQKAEIIKEFTFLRPRYRIDGLGWNVEGSFWEHDYEIAQGSIAVTSVHKQWMTWGDCYELDICNENNEIIALSAVLVIDCVMAAAASSSVNH